MSIDELSLEETLVLSSTSREEELEAALRAVAAVAPAGLPDLPDHAFVTQLEGVTLVCPWRTRVRAAEAFVDFSAGLHDDLADAGPDQLVGDRGPDQTGAAGDEDAGSLQRGHQIPFLTDSSWITAPPAAMLSLAA